MTTTELIIAETNATDAQVYFVWIELKKALSRDPLPCDVIAVLARRA